mgnify:CR=1 FL=1
MSQELLSTPRELYFWSGGIGRGDAAPSERPRIKNRYRSIKVGWPAVKVPFVMVRGLQVASVSLSSE